MMQAVREVLFGMTPPGRAFCPSQPTLKYELFSTSVLLQRVVGLNHRVSMTLLNEYLCLGIVLHHLLVGLSGVDCKIAQYFISVDTTMFD